MGENSPLTPIYNQARMGIYFEIQTRILGPRASKAEDEAKGEWMNPSCFQYQFGRSHRDALESYLRFGIAEWQGRNWRVREEGSTVWHDYNNVTTRRWNGGSW